MEKEIKIQAPEGYEIDKEKSTFERVVFKKKENNTNSWEDLKEIKGWFIDIDSNIEAYGGRAADDNKNIFRDTKYVKSALALAQISQLLPYYDSNVDWNNRNTAKYNILRKGNEIMIEPFITIYHLLAFKSKEEAERFLKYNEQLVKDYFML